MHRRQSSKCSFESTLPNRTSYPHRQKDAAHDAEVDASMDAVAQILMRSLDQPRITLDRRRFSTQPLDVRQTVYGSRAG